MHIQELHIELDVLLQRINSHWNQNFLPQEKDLFLNKQISSFINKRISRISNVKKEGLFDTIKRTVDLAPLLKTERCEVMYDDNTKEAYIMLPFDYRMYISSELHVCCSCMNKPVVNKTYYTYSISLKDISINSLPLKVVQGKNTFEITRNSFPPEYLIEDQVPIYEDKFTLINGIIKLLQKDAFEGLEFKYNKVNQELTLRSNNPFNTSFNGKTFLANNNNFNSYDIAGGLYSTVTPKDEEFKRLIKNSYLSGPTDDNAIAFIRADKVLYSMKGVIADHVNLTYLKKPNKIDLFLQCNSELSDDTLQEIVGETAQKMMGVLGTDNYEKFANENMIVE